MNPRSYRTRGLRSLWFYISRWRGLRLRIPLEAFLYVVLSHVGRDLAMGRSPVQGVLPKCLKGSIVSEANSESQQARRPNLWEVQVRKHKWDLIFGSFITSKTTAMITQLWLGLMSSFLKIGCTLWRWGFHYNRRGYERSILPAKSR